MNYVEKLKEIRKNNNFTQYEMSEFLSVKRLTYQRWEKGDFNPSPLALKEIKKFIKRFE